MRKPTHGALSILILLLPLMAACAAHGTDRIPSGAESAEEREVEAAARKYLDAEVARALKTVYECLAPSSIYRASHDYDTYLAQAQASPVRIQEYQILRITQIRLNEDKKTYPRVEKFAQVEVDLKVFFTDTKQSAEVNINFTFIKEGGRWYKG